MLFKEGSMMDLGRGFSIEKRTEGYALVRFHAYQIEIVYEGSSMQDVLTEYVNMWRTK